ncbi:hypothetical protein G7Y89_g8159 [Cudoniella acicularis]|uniref:Uncharacterized protein n=1 Tax=Cudoniella acicularis TaxID=354080 RepID=A0A8H4RKQ9_9HELO|nr:hypothetical protein G7Y89_g8159 [Cudoniella acicularis]
MESRRATNIVRLGSRIPRAAIGVMEAIREVAVPSRVIEARSTTTTDSSSANSSSSSCGANACEKGVSNSTFTLPIILGIVIPLVGATILFIILQRRHVKRQREEDLNDRHASMDFGLGNVPQPGRPKRNPAMSEMGMEDIGEKSRRQRQMSMDLSMNSPYLLPPELQNSRESLHSLSRTIHQNEDPYRPVTQYYPGDGASLHSQKQGSSIYTGSSGAPSRLQEVSTADLLSNAGEMPKSKPNSAFVPPPRHNSLHRSIASSTHEEHTPQPPLPYPSEPQEAYLPPHTATESISRKGLPMSPRPGQGLAPTPAAAPETHESFVSNPDASLRQSNNYLSALISEQEPPPPAPAPVRKPAPIALPSNPRPPRKESKPLPQSNDAADYGDGFKVTPPSPGRERMRGQRYSMDVPPEENQGQRIRSFYKEYFDDSKPVPEGQYYEDYDENYLGDAAYYDPETNAFVMPYSEPVTRRAMTPPPRGPRFQGPPRMVHGSMGAMSQGGRPPMNPGPRAYSSASGRMGPQKPRKPMPPPQALTSLPTPSKLKDDSFALMASTEFAPPTTFRDRAAGRSQSPFGERRPYSPTVPAFTPTASAFEELAPMPSPHLLRKSGTFTGLDFAPPKKFRDPDAMSDAGSIRSNQSGISQRQLGAIRGGAYRVSRIPQNVVSTKDDMAAVLKPKWDMAR